MSYFSAFVGRRVCRILGRPLYRLVGWPTAIKSAALQIAEWCVHKNICNKTMRFEGADFLRVVESQIGNGRRSAS